MSFELVRKKRHIFDQDAGTIEKNGSVMYDVMMS
jgi:hypothetical protein